MLKSKISGKWFNGVFDGGFHKITGLYIDTISDIHSNESTWNSNAALFHTIKDGIIKNLYLEGEISSPKGCAGLVYWLGNITARNSMAGGSIWNSYYREDCIDESNEYGEPKSADFMRTQEFVDLLNSGNETDVWTMDAENTNDGYPIIGDTHFGVSENFFTNTDLVIVYPNPATDYIMKFVMRNGSVVTKKIVKK